MTRRIPRQMGTPDCGAGCALTLAALCLAACASPSLDAAAPPPIDPPSPPAVVLSCAPSYSQTGIASWYGEAFHLKQTASGEPFDMNDLTAAHRWLPLNTIVRVTNLHNERSVVLRINDRGPYVGKRAIDVSSYAAMQLGMKNAGVAPVRIEVFDLDRRNTIEQPLLTASDSRTEKSGARRADAGSSSHYPEVGSLLAQP